MERKCFLCCSDVEVLFVQNLDIPGLAFHDIGFSICPECGLVLQSPTVSSVDMHKHYSKTAVYINPGTNGKPSERKRKFLARQVQFVLSTIGEIPASVFQVGCSDGFTLSEFQRAGAATVSGIDPGLASNKLAKELYDIESVVGTFEEFVPNQQYDLIILTHILEHLYDPLKAMIKCSEMQKDNGWIFIEVPLLERIDRLPPGYFTFEHLNYFSELALLHMLTKVGYVPYSTAKLFYVANYPIISIMAKKECSKTMNENCSDYERADSLLKEFWRLEEVRWKMIEQKVKRHVKKGASVYVWGAGMHTSQLLAFTDLKSYLSIIGLIDSSPTKWGKQLGDIECYAPDNVLLKKDDIVLISSYASEKEIFDSLAKDRSEGVIIQRLYADS